MEIVETMSWGATIVDSNSGMVVVSEERVGRWRGCVVFAGEMKRL